MEESTSQGLVDCQPKLQVDRLSFGRAYGHYISANNIYKRRTNISQGLVNYQPNLLADRPSIGRAYGHCTPINDSRKKYRAIPAISNIV